MKFTFRYKNVIKPEVYQQKEEHNKTTETENCNKNKLILKTSAIFLA